MSNLNHSPTLVDLIWNRTVGIWTIIPPRSGGFYLTVVDKMINITYLEDESGTSWLRLEGHLGMLGFIK
jgi:hypothetical protein